MAGGFAHPPIPPMSSNLNKLFPRASKSFLEKNEAALATAEAVVDMSDPVSPADIAKVRSNLVIQPSTDEAKLNKTERAYLNLLRAQGYPWIGVQNITLKLGDDCRYSPDFWTIGPNGELMAHEVKGFFRDDAKVKLKVAARMFTWIRFILIQRKAGQWIETEVKA